MGTEGQETIEQPAGAAPLVAPLAPQKKGEVERLPLHWCPICQEEVAPYTEAGSGGTGADMRSIAGGGAVSRCPVCHEPTREQRTVNGTVEQRPCMNDQGVAIRYPAQPIAGPALPAGGATRPDNFFMMATERLAWIETSLAQVAELKSEAGRLRRLLGLGRKTRG